MKPFLAFTAGIAAVGLVRVADWIIERRVAHWVDQLDWEKDRAAVLTEAQNIIRRAR